MRRRTFDTLMSTGGIVITAVLVIAGALLYWGHSFADGNVREQLTAQRIYFPKADNPQLRNPEIGPYIRQYAGRQLTTGAQAEAYAMHYIAVHLKETNNGKTYSETSTEARENPNNAELQQARQTLFMGETLKGLLLNAYAFWKVGQLAKLGAFAAFGLAGLMAILTILGFWHLRRTDPTEEFLAPVVSAGSRKSA